MPEHECLGNVTIKEGESIIITEIVSINGANYLPIHLKLKHKRNTYYVLLDNKASKDVIEAIISQWEKH